MARRGRFGTGGTGQNYAGDIRSYIAQSLGTDAVPAQETETKAPEPISSKSSYYDIQKAIAASKPDYSGLDFTGLDRSGVKQLQKTVQSPEYIAARKALSERKKRFATPYTAEEIAKDPAKRAIASGITFEQALADYRKLVKVMNLVPLSGQSRTAKQEKRFNRLNASLTPQQKASQRILGLLGAYQGRPGEGEVKNRLTGETNLETFYRRMGMLDKLPTGTKQSPETYRVDPKFGPIINIPNPLSQQQRSRLQRLRGMAPSSLTKQQQAALARLRMKKNAPKIIP